MYTSKSSDPGGGAGGVQWDILERKGHCIPPTTGYREGTVGHTRAESPPQAENFADFGPLNQRFTMGKRSQKGSKKSISGPLLSPPLLSQISQKEGGTDTVIIMS